MDLKKTYKVGKWEDCPKCGRMMERRSHGVNETSYKNKAYYYTEWDYCPQCKHVQHYEKFKIKPLAPISPAVKDIWGL